MSQGAEQTGKLLDQATRVDFDSALLNAIRVSNGTAGISTTPSKEIASQLLTQNVITGLTIASIVNPAQRTGIAGLPSSFTVTDLPSLCILTRGIIEAYLTLFYIAIQPVSASETEFRLLWWRWHEVNERVWQLEKIGSKVPQLQKYRKRCCELRLQISQHPARASLPKKLREEFEKNKSPKKALIVEMAAIAQMAGIHETQFRVVYKGLSEYAHAQPMAVSTLLGLTAASPEVVAHFSEATRFATSFLLFSVRDYLKIFPEGRDFTDGKFWELVAIWSEVHNADLAQVQI